MRIRENPPFANAVSLLISILIVFGMLTLVQQTGVVPLPVLATPGLPSAQQVAGALGLIVTFVLVVWMMVAGPRL